MHLTIILNLVQIRIAGADICEDFAECTGKLSLKANSS